MKETFRSAGWLLRLAWDQDRTKTAVALILVLSNAIAAPLHGPGDGYGLPTRPSTVTSPERRSRAWRLRPA